ncbi:MAG: isoprenylcysteine carboxylmethyltransferase family protein [Candidatus Cyclonatronum sp.]|uniref:methyltransferase family protein n=1 Tax=Cyclonatronum sp. TaxID=3024185 RepID=UPI0025C0448F|nr:isoprenylcysteine carboxylmethyltransferase family protein [Cyclonatronum sp.]MCH8486142.1 isoprenylcysteine carboxylmethyltransferase family protein [Cyclonatronum sp.]
MIFAVAFLAFAVLHSLLASRAVKSRVIGALPFMRWYYRLLYNMLALVTFGLVWFLAPVEHQLLYHIEPPGQWLMHLIQLGALAGLWLSLRHAGSSAFLGLVQLRDARRSETNYDLDEPASAQIAISGPFRYMRHPLYVFSIILLIAHPIMTLKWALFTLCCILYFVIGSRFEERRLLARFGDSYAEYRKQVPAFIPIILHKLYSNE